MFAALKSKAAGLAKPKPSKAELAAEAARKKEEEALLKSERDQVALLPWNIGDWIKIGLFLVLKLPVIVAVGIIATLVEMQVKELDRRSWHRPTTTSGPSCFVTELSKPLKNYSTSVNQIFTDLGVGPLYNESKLVVNVSEMNFTFKLTDSDLCGVQKNNCSVDEKQVTEGNLVEDNGWFNMKHGGIAFGYFFPFAFLWMIYKLVWIPLWPVDRIALCMAGGQTPAPEPVFRLVTMPHFQVCTGFLQIVMMILNNLRYVFLPNYLLMPLTTLSVVDDCPEDKVLIHYRMDWIFGQAAYLWLVADFVSVVAAYLFFKVVFGARVIGTWTYRAYKSWWILSSFTAITLFFTNLAFNFDVNFFAGLNFAFLLSELDLNVFFSYSIDFLAFLAAANYFMESLSMTYLIYGLVLPLICGRVPCVKKFYEKKTEKRDEEQGPLLGHRR